MQAGGTLLGAWAAISLYKKQKGDKEDEEAAKTRNQESAKLRYLTYLILKAAKFNNDLIVQLEDCIDRISKNPLAIGGMSIYPENNLVRLVDKINHEDYYLSYVNRFVGKDKEISLLFDAVDGENKVKQLIYDSWLESLNNNNIKGTQIQNARKELTHELRFLQNNDLLPTETVSDIVKIMSSYSEKAELNGGGYRSMADDLFLPIADYLDEAKNIKHRAAITKIYNISSENYTQINRLAYDNQMLQIELKHHVKILKEVRLTNTTKFLFH